MSTQEEKQQDEEERIFRNLELRIYPGNNQAQKLRWLIRWHRRLYNHFRHHQIWAYKDPSRVTDRIDLPEHRTFIPINAHRNYITWLRQASPEQLNLDEPVNPYSQMNVKSLQAQAERVQKAFKDFFRRAQDPQKTNAGFPRYKTKNRFKSITFKDNGWQLAQKRHSPHDRARQDLAAEFLASAHKNGYLYLQGVGWMQIRGQTREAIRDLFDENKGTVKQLTIKEKRDGWYLFVKAEFSEKPSRKAGSEAVGIDWGIHEYATLAVEGKDPETGEEGQHFWKTLGVNKVFDHLQELQTKLDQLKSKRDRRKERGSNAWSRLNDRVASLQQKITRTREDVLHKITATLVQQFYLISVEATNNKGMTGSARGTRENPGTNVKQKAALNRAILNRSPGRFVRQLARKAEEADCEFETFDARKHAPTKTCHVCGTKSDKKRGDRKHHCPQCGVICDRDYNAARVVLNLALFQCASFLEAGLLEQPDSPVGRGPARCGGAGGEGLVGLPETPSVKHEVRVSGLGYPGAPQ